MYPVPACELPLSISSTEALNDELLVSIDNTWFLTGTISFESGVTVTFILVLAAPSTLEILVILADVKIISPLV